MQAGVVDRLRMYIEHGIDSGTASDAERIGLPLRVDNGVALVSLKGAMMRSAGPWASMFGIVGSDQVRQALISADADGDVESIVLRIDSPGGSVSGMAELADAVAAASKPVIAQVEGMAASAAYYVASQAGRIVMGRNDMVGSIGTRIMLYDYSKAFADNGIEAVPIDSGKFKSAGVVGAEITEEQRADFQRTVDFYYADFLAAVSAGRNMDHDEVAEVGDGRMFSSAEAVGLGLVDSIGTIEKTLSGLRKIKGRGTGTARARLKI